MESIKKSDSMTFFLVRDMNIVELVLAHTRATIVEYFNSMVNKLVLKFVILELSSDADIDSLEANFDIVVIHNIILGNLNLIVVSEVELIIKELAVIIVKYPKTMNFLLITCLLME